VLQTIQTKSITVPYQGIVICFGSSNFRFSFEKLSLQKIKKVEQKAILLELQYLPPIQYFVKFFQYENVIIEQHEHYAKRSYRNRCHIATPNGIQRLSVPLKSGKNEQQSIRKVLIAYEENWQKNHWSAIRSAYSNAPFFEHYEENFQPFFIERFEFLFDFNFDLLKMVLRILDINQLPKLTAAFQKETPDRIVDFRNQITPKSENEKQFHNFKTMKYSQVFEEKNGFIPNLSILDLIFCTGPQASFYLENSITT
jgi:hypothetical protein